MSGCFFRDLEIRQPDYLKKCGIRRVALVVDKRSMLRAEACLRKQGIDFVPAPAYRTQLDFGDGWMPRASTISQIELTLHETLGSSGIWLRGWWVQAATQSQELSTGQDTLQATSHWISE